MVLSRLNHTASALAAGTVRSMVGFAGIVTAPRRKTRSGCWLSSTRWDLNPRVPSKGFKVTSCYFSPFPKHGILSMPSWREDYSRRPEQGRVTSCRNSANAVDRDRALSTE